MKVVTDIGPSLRKKSAGKENKLIEFLNWSDIHTKRLDERLKKMSLSAKNESYSLTRMVDNLIGDMRKVVMLPFSTVLEVLPKMVRDLSKEKGKWWTFLSMALR